MAGLREGGNEHSGSLKAICNRTSQGNEMKLGGHVARLHQTKWAHAVTIWDPYVGKRGQEDHGSDGLTCFIKEAGKQWSRTAKNRVLWKELGMVIRSHNTRLILSPTHSDVASQRTPAD
ncbi:hypothetical protein ANN_08266 [Periplaneta americana]|uniref:Per a allergen n=1 Tax=Periplaneta americana TaxID=6978 RepID=A0ABQ8T0X4_PERAM|nr:hypothetical protein ANN_08266 [Periplaneta americana]